jgi:DNA-binding IclR family transcriptional regulator
MTAESPRERRGIQSLEIGIRLFQDIHRLGRSVTLNELAKLAGMPPSKAHRYCTSLVRTGLLQQDGRGVYGIGPYGFKLGHADAERAHARTLAVAALAGLVRRIGETVFLSEWGNVGPTILHVADAPRPISIRPTAQGDLPLHNSATGRVYAAYLEPARLNALLDVELETFQAEKKVAAADVAARKRTLLRQLPEIRRRRLARSTGERYPGLNSFAAPIFDRQGRVILSLTAFGFASTFPPSWNAPIPRALQACAAELTERVGGQAPGG